VDALARLPADALLKLMQESSGGKSLLAIKAGMKGLGRF